VRVCQEVECVCPSITEPQQYGALCVQQKKDTLLPMQKALPTGSYIIMALTGTAQCMSVQQADTSGLHPQPCTPTPCRATHTHTHTHTCIHAHAEEAGGPADALEETQLKHLGGGGGRSSTDTQTQTQHRRVHHRDLDTARGNAA